MNSMDHPPYSVAELVETISRLTEDAYADIEVDAEISNLRRPASGHAYFTLKDEKAQLRAVAWRSVMQRLPFRPEDGQQVVARGRITVYAARGDLQMQVSALRPAGVGMLQKTFEELKRRLDSEGLFDPHRKRTLPRYPRTIGIITSRTGAVLHDLQSVIERRYPLVRLLLWSVRVQGAEAAGEIVEAVRGFNRLAPDHADRPDVLVVGRGGGSLEDLWPFNEERVARAIHASGIPVVSAVGHETDVTICDLVADVRAATPSVAAERMVPDVLELMRHLSEQVRGLGRRAGNRLSARRMQLASLDARLRLHAPERRIARVHQQVDDLLDRLGRAMDTRLRGANGRVDAMQDRLRALDPSRPLQAGYALVRSGDSMIRSASRLREGDPVTMQFSDGVTHARVDVGNPNAADVDP